MVVGSFMTNSTPSRPPMSSHGPRYRGEGSKLVALVTLVARTLTAKRLRERMSAENTSRGRLHVRRIPSAGEVHPVSEGPTIHAGSNTLVFRRRLHRESRGIGHNKFYTVGSRTNALIQAALSSTLIWVF
jgi:hypothetical protein